MNIQNTCRICLQQKAKLYGLFDSITPEVDSSSSGVFAKNHDASLQMSDQICHNCRNEILGAYSFARKCESAKGICKQLNKQVKVKLKRLKHTSSKVEITKPFRYIPVKQKQKDKKPQIPLKDDQWELSDKATNSQADEAIKPKIMKNEYPKVNIVQMNEVQVPNSIEEAEKKDLNGRSHFKCNICEKTFAMQISYRRHIKTHSTQNGGVECPICKITFSSHAVFEAHSFLHSIAKRKPLGRAKKFDCSQCSRKFAGQRALDVHERSHAGVKKKTKAMFEYHCASCDKVFTSAKALSAHGSRHEKQHKCNLCSKLFASRGHLINHLTKHEVMNPFECDVCDKAFPEKVYLDEHMKSHGNEKTYLCAMCGKYFRNHQKYLQHMEEHNTIKADKDTNQIRSSFDMEFRKMNLFQAQNPYACDMCDARFPKHVELIRHRQVHANDASHVCEICNDKFQMAYALKLHMRIHSDEKQFDCGLCGESFKDDAALAEHMKSHRSTTLSVTKEKPEIGDNVSEILSKSILRVAVNSVPTNVEVTTVETVK